jgi:mono/diheme cytochrome c family protein
VRGGLAIVLAVSALMSSGCGSSGPSAEVKRGAALLAQSGCLDCHGYGGIGAFQSNAPNLTREADRKRGTDWQVRHLRRPRSLVQDSTMPSYRSLTTEQLKSIAKFLEDSDGRWQATDFWFGSGV